MSTEPREAVAGGVHYVVRQSVSASRLCCGSVSFTVKRADRRVRLEIPREEWAALVEELVRV